VTARLALAQRVTAQLMMTLALIQRVLALA
jgi:hypothetical protein